jgi:ABC-type uncharacterized transport system ATPase subunit
MMVTLRFSSVCNWQLPADVECLSQSPDQLTARMPREQMQSFLNRALAACEVADMRIEEEDMGNLVEKIYTLEGVSLERSLA